MNTSFLKNFIAVVEEKSISSAARREHIAQSALSLQLKTLEDEAGCVLLKRSRHGVSLSDEGEIFYRYARRILGLENEMKDRVEEISAGGGGVLRLGISSSCISNVMDNQLCRFGRRYPNVKYELFEKSGAEVLTALRSGIVDVGIINSMVAPTQDMRTHFKSFEPMAVLYNRELNFFEDASIPFSALRGIPLCIAKRSAEVIRHVCALNGFEPVISAQCEQFETAANLALCGKGAAIVPLAIAERYLYYIHEDKRSYFNTERVKVYTAQGKRVYPEICDACFATENKSKCSVMLPKGFDGWLLYPLDISATLPIVVHYDARIGLDSLSEITSLLFDFRFENSRKGQHYAIGGIYLTDSLEALPDSALMLDDFAYVGSIADDYRMEDMSVYGQRLSSVSVQPINGLDNAMVLTLPTDGQYVDNIHCGAEWVRSGLVNNIGKYRYFAIRVINPDIDRLAFSIGLIESRRLSLARLQENVLDTSFMVLSCQDHILSPLAEEFIREFTDSPTAGQ